MAKLSPVQKALLETISGPESAGSYDVMYGGDHFNSYADHPRTAVPITSGPNKGLTSSAAGKYQFLGSTWDEQAKELGLTDFSPASQDQAAWHLAEKEYRRDTGRDLTSDLDAGDLSRVPSALRDQWTSMPGGIEQGIGTDAFGAAFNANRRRLPDITFDPGAPTPDLRRSMTGVQPAARIMAPARVAEAPGGGWLSGFMGSAKGGINSALGAISGQTAPLMRGAQGIAPAAIMQALSTVEGRSAIGHYLANKNVAAAPTMVSGFQPGGTQVLGTNGQQGTLMRAAGGQIGGQMSRAFDDQFHTGQNMDVYRTNAAAAGGAGNLNAAGSNAALQRGANLVSLAPQVMRSSGGGGLSTYGGAGRSIG